MSQSHGSHSSSHPSVPAGEALALLRAGNESFRDNRFRNEVASGRYQELLEGQHPFAAILCCSDSRVPPELIFDRGLGELFVIRNPGNVLHDVVLGSIEYAVDHLGIQLIVVLGHEKCGAITATVASSMEPAPGALTQGHLASIINRIRPALEKVRGQEGDLVANTIDAHVVDTVASLKADPVFAQRMEQGRLTVVGMRYNLSDGTVVTIA
jgi:carbonic anhydrase